MLDSEEDTLSGIDDIPMSAHAVEDSEMDSFHFLGLPPTSHRPNFD